MQGLLLQNDANTGWSARVPNSLLWHSTASLDFGPHSIQATAETERHGRKRINARTQRVVLICASLLRPVDF